MTIAQVGLDRPFSSQAPAAISAAAAVMVLIAANRSAKGRPPGARDGNRSGKARSEIGGGEPHSTDSGTSEPARPPATRKLPTGLY